MTYDRRLDVAHEAISAGLRKLAIELMSPPQLPQTMINAVPSTFATAQAVDPGSATNGSAGRGRLRQRLANRREAQPIESGRVETGGPADDGEGGLGGTGGHDRGRGGVEKAGASPSSVDPDAPRSTPSKDVPRTAISFQA